MYQMWRVHCIKCGGFIVSNVAVALYQIWRVHCTKYGGRIVPNVAVHHIDA